ncbi:unnamed protein product [Prorocentrum cordatum]|uniref:PDZ domain-containing protein n=1 Tax=Prorocentrum cordatum TaxID=2364126 RepID=A0ABN9T053_9DINO|nr:unnamed protein product [Polarella glacialis]
MVPIRTLLFIVAIVPAAALSYVADLQSVAENRERIQVENKFELESGSESVAEARERMTIELSRMGVEFESRSQDTVTFSPAERLAMHASKFEAEFDADLDMTAVVTEGKSVGVTFDMDTDFQPVSVLKVKKNGVLQDWNNAHPDKAVMVGDEVVRVNDIQWHANSQTFAERIKGQFLAAKHQKPGASNILRLHIQRPRRQRAVRYAAQREDLHRKLYSAEFVAEIPMKGVLPHDPINQAMGWRLNSSVDWTPVSIEKLRTVGLVAKYNKEHPEARIVAGDEIIQVNHIPFHHSAATFEERLGAQYLAARTKEYTGAPDEKNVLRLYIRRPRSAGNDAPQEQVYTKYYSVDLSLRDAHTLGWQLNASSDSEPITVAKIMTKKGHPIQMHNEAHPDNMIRVGDSVLRVNDVTWHGNTRKFAERISKEFEKVRPHHAKGQSKDAQYYSVSLTLVDNHALGWHLNVGNDSDPITVDKIMQKKGHPIYNYNLANPTNLVQVGDSVLRVNDVTWHGNTKKFAERIDKEFEKARPRHSKDNTTEPHNTTLQLLMKRGNEQPAVGLAEEPSSTPMKLFLQRRLVQPIAKEWTVTMPAEEEGALGWQLDYSEDEFPVTVSKIRTNGVVFEFNQEHPDSRIVPGDIIVKVDDLLWREDSSNFSKLVGDKFTKAKKRGNISFFMRRPQGVRDTTNDLSADRPFFKEFLVKLPVLQSLGWQLSTDNDTAPLTIAKIRTTGAVHDWNEKNPLNDIQVGDHIAKVNNIVWHNNTQEFSQKLNLQMSAARKGMAKPMIQLLVQRPWRTAEPESKDDSDDDGVIGASEDVSGGGEDEMGATN